MSKQSFGVVSSPYAPSLSRTDVVIVVPDPEVPAGGWNYIHGDQDDKAIPTADNIVGTSGYDKIYGAALNDTLNGGGGNDWLEGDDGDDVLNGGDGRDWLTGDAGVDHLYGDAGDDTIMGGDGGDILNGFSGDDFLQGEAGNDDIGGGYGRDYLSGGDGNDVLNGGNGDDFLLSDLGDDVLDGGEGIDIVVFALAANAIKVDLRRTDFGGQEAGEGRDVFLSIENVTGSSWNDTLTGSAAVNVLTGSEGNDTLNGKGGSDKLIGAEGADRFVFDTKPNKKTNLDVIIDFSRAEKDKIVLDNDIFKALGHAGTLKQGYFQVGVRALDADDHILFNKSAHALAYDPDGSGPQAAVMFAKVFGIASLKYSDFLIID